jgi:predicted phosphate transport protein (TIGR00153 family)
MKSKTGTLPVEEIPAALPAEQGPYTRLDMYQPKKRGFSLKRLFKRRQDSLLLHIREQARLTVEGLDALKTYMSSQDPAAAALLVNREKQADEARRILICELNKTFITPFDREDIFALSRTIDDVLDYAYSTLSEMEVLKVKPTSFMQRIASLVRDGAYEILMAVERLEDHPAVANEHAQRAKALENKVEDVYREALADLFTGAEDIKHVVKMLKCREVYRHLSNASDRADEAANVIADIVVKII